MDEIRNPDTGGRSSGPPVDIGPVVALISALQKALKAYRLYLPSHPLLKDFVSGFHGSLSNYLAHHDDLCLRIGQTRISLADETVYEGSRQEESLAFRLFIHGVREITFQHGISLTEVTDFLQVIRRTFASQADTDDLIATVWEKDFAHVDFIILEDLFDDSEAADYEAFLREAGNDADEAATYSDPRPAPVRPSISPEDRAALPDLLRMSREENAAIALAVRTETIRSPMEEISAVFPDIILHSAGVARPTDILALSQKTIEALLAKGEFAAAAALHTELTQPLPLYGSDSSPILGQGLSTPRILAALRPHLAEAVLADSEAVANLLLHLGPGISTWLVDRLSEPQAASAAASLLRKLPASELVPVLDCLPDANLSTAVTIVRILGDARLSEAMPHLSAALRHSEMQVRREAVLAIQKIGTAEAFEPLLKVIADKSSELGILAARALQHLPAGAHFRELIPLVRAKEFAKRPPIERNEILSAIGRSENGECEEFLAGLAVRRGLFRNQARDALRVAAVTALAHGPMSRVRELIEPLMKDRSPEVRRAAELALRQR